MCCNYRFLEAPSVSRRGDGVISDLVIYDDFEYPLSVITVPKTPTYAPLSKQASTRLILMFALNSAHEYLPFLIMEFPHCFGASMIKYSRHAANQYGCKANGQLMAWLDAVIRCWAHIPLEDLEWSPSRRALLRSTWYSTLMTAAFAITRAELPERHEAVTDGAARRLSARHL